MFRFKEVSDEKLMERIIKVNKYRKYHALIYFIFSVANFAILFYFYLELEPKFLASYKKIIISMFKVGRIIQESDADTLDLAIKGSHYMGLKIGTTCLSLGFGGTLFLFHALYALVGGRKDRLLIKFYEESKLRYDSTNIKKY